MSQATASATKSKSATPRKRKAAKPAKPYPDFPLFLHATKRWAKKIKGKMCYFGPWADPDGALATYQGKRDELFAGRTPRPQADDVLTLRDLCNRFLTHKRHLLETGELSPRTFAEGVDTLCVGDVPVSRGPRRP